MISFDDRAEGDLTGLADTEFACIDPAQVRIIGGYRKTCIALFGGDDEFVRCGVLIVAVN